MFKKTITYADYNGVKHTENLYFSLSKAELSDRTHQTETYDLTNCKNCGAPLPGYPCKCEYCRTVYGKIDSDEYYGTVDSDEYQILCDKRGELKKDLDSYWKDGWKRRSVESGAISFNEMRRLIGLPPLNDYDWHAYVKRRMKYL